MVRRARLYEAASRRVQRADGERPASSPHRLECPSWRDSARRPRGELKVFRPERLIQRIRARLQPRRRCLEDGRPGQAAGRTGEIFRYESSGGDPVNDEISETIE